MKKSTFNRTPLAAGIALALGATAMVPAQAQEEEVMEEIVTTGIRASLMQSMDRKRDAKGVVDAITSEDIGKFPDQNLAEALQRITGVSIDRSNNEGSRITVRGMGPEFNLVTLNGRSMPTAGGRSFDFGDIATEGVRAVEIYKTAKANLPTGGIGATVNIETARPLQNPGFQSVLSAKMVHETSSSDASVANLDEYTPEIAGLFSNTFADDKFGVLISASYQERDNREENAAVDNWGPNLQLSSAAGGTVNGISTQEFRDQMAAEGKTWFHPQNYGVGWSDISRDRINGQLVLQYAPTDQITATLDYTYSEVKTLNNSNSTGIWFECPNIDATVNERGTVTQVTQSCNDYSTNIARSNTVKENKSLGLNLDYMVNDALTLTLDVHQSSSDSFGGGIHGEPGTSANLIIGNSHDNDWGDFVDGGDTYPEPLSSAADIDLQTATYGPNGIPVFEVSFVDQGLDAGVPVDFLRASDIGSLFGQAFNNETYNDILQAQLSGSWENLDSGALRRIDFGISHTEQEFDSRSAASGLLGAGFWLQSNAWWPDENFEQGDFNGLLSGFSNGGSFPESRYWTTGFDYAVDQYETIGVGDFAGFAYWVSDNGGWCDENFTSTLGPENCTSADGSRGRFWSGPLGSGGASLIDEVVDSFYTQFTFEDEFNGMAFNAVLGVRYEETDMTSYGQEAPPSGIIWTSGNEFSYGASTGNTFRRGSNKNDFWLPSMDLDLGITDELIARLSYSRSIARPPIGALSPARSFIGSPTVRNRTASSGNPNLLPYLSDNFDLSLEYYYGNGSYASIGYFKKKVDNFLVSTTIEETFEGLTDPYISAEAEQARAELVAEGASPDDPAVFQRINENRGLPITTVIRGLPGDPLATFRVTTTENAEVGNLFGWELAVQHMFSDTGWGVQANYTVVNGDVEADPDIIGEQFYLPGLSDSANLSVFYENDIISARLAYNWRDTFLSGTDQFGAPVFTEEYAPLDLNVTWYATDDLSVFFEAINITEEVQRLYSRYPEQFVRGNEYGSRFNIGARYHF